MYDNHKGELLVGLNRCIESVFNEKRLTCFLLNDWEHIERARYHVNELYIAITFPTCR